ncbi:hypothetical protein AC249_AIPGENE28337 [Exaiptasia diaphana]|nr:hypothetical protein AC249_AIPGENE28337 [Exaiptasia diaphana]
MNMNEMAMFLIALCFLCFFCRYPLQEETCNVTSSFQHAVKLIHDIETNPGPAGPQNKSQVKIGHLNVRSMKSYEQYKARDKQRKRVERSKPQKLSLLEIQRRKKLNRERVKKCKLSKKAAIQAKAENTAEQPVYKNPQALDKAVGKDKRILRNYGRSFKGTRAEVARLRQPWGPRISAIPVVSTDGILDIGIYDGHVDGALFLHFVNTTLAPHLQPFNGFNARSIVVLDNARIHHYRHVVNAINATGALLMFLPPYSPDYMPCEGVFSQAKSWIKENDLAWQVCDHDDSKLMVFESFLQIPPSDVVNYIKYAEYM